MTSQKKQVTRYQVAYQLGGRSRKTHTDLAAAVRYAADCADVAYASGDVQGIRIVALDDGEERELTHAEYAAVRKVFETYDF